MAFVRVKIEFFWDSDDKPDATAVIDSAGGTGGKGVSTAILGTLRSSDVQTIAGVVASLKGRNDRKGATTRE